VNTAGRFAAELVKAQKVRGVTNVELARRVGVRPEWISTLRRGEQMPGHQLAVAMAEALTWDGLVPLSLAKRTGTCETCAMPFLSLERGGNPRRFCGRGCKLTAQRRRRIGRTSRTTAVQRHRLSKLQAAITAYCRGCEPEGLCRDSECELRPVSPLPLARMRAA
jgi:DNA-binding XRE family transcriptional regulator